MTLQDWLAQIEAEPNNWFTYQAFSDWLKDYGMVALGHAVWWMWKRKRFPRPFYRYGSDDFLAWEWYGEGFGDRIDPAHLLPWQMLERNSSYHSTDTLAMLTWLAGQLQNLRRVYNAE